MIEHIQITAMAVAEAIAVEREQCAKIALAIDSGRGNERAIAEAIRARGQQRTPHGSQTP